MTVENDEWMRIGGHWGDNRFDFEVLVEDTGLIGQMADAFRNNKAYEPEITFTLMRILEPGDTFIDVGANVGYFTLLAAQLVGPRGTVIAFEPGSNVLPTLERNIARNIAQDDRPPLATIDLVRQPAAEAAGRDIVFHLNADGGAGNALYPPGNIHPQVKESDRVTLRSTTIDAECARHAIDPERLAAIKIDVEGAEIKVLEGAAATIAKHRPKVVFAELHPWGLAQLGGTPMELRRLMASFGYWTWLVRPADPHLLPHYLPPGVALDMYLYVDRVIPTFNLMFATPQTVGRYWRSVDLHYGGPKDGVEPRLVRA